MHIIDRTSSVRSRTQRPGSNIALAIALVAGTALSIGAFAEPAFAKKRDRDEAKAPKTDYSKGFIGVYTPFNALLTGEAADPAAAKAMLPELLASLKTGDDRNAAGGLVFNLGRSLSDTQMQIQGLDLMLESGKNDQDKNGQLHFTSQQIFRGLGDFSSARASMQAAIEANYSFQGQLSDGTTRTFTTNDLRVMMSELYFAEDDYDGGFGYLQALIDSEVSAGNKPEETWLRRGFSVANDNDLTEWALSLSAQHVQYYPSAVSWSNALAVQRNSLNMDDNATLDVMRLVDRTGAMNSGRDYVDYIESADPRRLPGEVKRIVDQGIANGMLEANDPFVQEAKATANGRIAADRADLPALESDARKSNSSAVTATAAGDVFLSYGKAGKAEEMYMIAATRTGADLGRVYTRMGIAQTDLGKIEAAKATFAKVGGVRAPIAGLWALYAESKAVPAPVAGPAEIASDTAM